jgi:hypothetical protein
MDTAAALTSETLAAGRSNGAVPRQELAAWIARGRAEEQRSRAVARVALAEITRDVMHYLTHDDAVQELIQSHSGGLVEDTLDEVRERAVSADLAVSRVVDRLLRRGGEVRR